MGGLLRFPNPVNEVSARLVAAGVVVLCVTALVTQQGWLLLVIAYGFLARVLTGPTLSPLGQLVTRVITPRLGLAERPVPGPPKRFAQGIGAAFSLTAAGLHYVADAPSAAWLVLGALTVPALLESGLGYCVGCRIFAGLMRLGVVPETVCAECGDLSGRLATSQT